mmetsp:Transcript_14264/g.32371  ORF Transcript_14264/g.32371 Transcript_14264/m.32371 type:complete len:257 (-) Transcript_14264:620-1390(-)
MPEQDGPRCVHEFSLGGQPGPEPHDTCAEDGRSVHAVEHTARAARHDALLPRYDTVAQRGRLLGAVRRSRVCSVRHSRGPAILALQETLEGVQRVTTAGWRPRDILHRRRPQTGSRDLAISRASQRGAGPARWPQQGLHRHSSSQRGCVHSAAGGLLFPRRPSRSSGVGVLHHVRAHVPHLLLRRAATGSLQGCAYSIPTPQPRPGRGVSAAVTVGAIARRACSGGSCCHASSGGGQRAHEAGRGSRAPQTARLFF